MNKIWNIIIYLLVSVMLCITSLLIMEYQFFKTQAQKLIELQEEYQSYLDTFKEKLEFLELNKAFSDEQKKKAKFNLLNNQEFGIANQTLYPAPLKIVNRNSLYLRNEALKYGRIFHLESALNTLYAVGKSISASVTQATKKKPTQRPRKYTRNQKKYVTELTMNWPIEEGKFWISSAYGPRKKVDGSWGFHHGIDLAAPKATPIYPVADGKVIEVSFNPEGFGKSIVIAHSKKWKTRYAHLHSMFVKVGQKVTRRQKIGTVGNTGLVRGKNGTHLHLEIMVFGKRVNPLYILS